MKGMLAVLALAFAGADAHAKGCHESSYVVGYAHCSRFGDWSRDQPYPRIFIELGYFHHTFLSPPFALDATTAALAGADARPTPTTELTTRAQGGVMRFGAGIGRVAYAGFDLLPGTLTTVPQYEGPTPTTSLYFGSHAFAGVHGSLWRLGFGAELAAGGRVAIYQECATRNCKTTLLQSVTQTRRELEARAHVDLYFHPHFSLGFAVADSLIDRGDHQFLVTLGLHMRAEDGT